MKAPNYSKPKKHTQFTMSFTDDEGRSVSVKVNNDKVYVTRDGGSSYVCSSKESFRLGHILIAASLGDMDA